MRKLSLLLPLLLVFAGLLIYLNSQQPNLVQQRMEGQGITLLPSTIPVDANLQQSVLNLLAPDAPKRSVFTYAITNVSDLEDGYFHVSVAGLPCGMENMILTDAVWFGMVTVADLPGYPGEVIDLSTQLTTSQVDYEHGGGSSILPFRSGTTAIYGLAGVHDCGFSLNGWKAVDLFPSENMVYSSNSGDVSYVCRDENQVALRIGQNLYTHIADTGQQTGDHYEQGGQIGAMVPGSFTSACGYADQQPQNYHVHFCFVPDGTWGYYGWSADGYALYLNDGKWYKGEETVSPGGTLTAEWADANGNFIPGPTAGFNLWDSLTGGVIDMVEGMTGPFPEHQQIGLADTVINNTQPWMQLLYVLVFSNFSMTIPIMVIGIISILEGVRIIYALYMLVKRLIPVIG